MAKFALTVLAMGLGTAVLPASAQIQRVLGLDISAWQGNISPTTWTNIHNVENRQFIILRSSRGGTTGYYNQNDPNNANGLNTLSQRYDDPYFVQNINRVATAGMFAGSYHFSRPDIIETTFNSGGIANTGTDEADHFIQMAGPWMRPGYLIPVHDFEAGDGIRTDEQMAQFCVDFSNRIYEKMGIRPAIYINGNYAAFVLGGASAALRNQLAQPSSVSPSLQSPANLKLWSARWPNQADPNSIDVQNGEPKDSYTQIYGPWDDYGVTHPWTFWQYASTGRLQSFNNGGSNLDFDVARGGIEFLKDQLVPAVWTHNDDGDWSTLTNWNSGLTPIAPVQGTGQVARVGTLILPAARLPGASGSGVTSGQHDTVILERPNANITVTLASGTHNLRRLYMREALNITGGSLTVNHVPSADSTTNGAQFSGPVALSNSASLSVHTLQVDAAQTFTLAGGVLTLNTIKLMPGATPAKLLVAGDVSLSPLANATATIAKGNGSGNTGFIDLAGGARMFTIGDGTGEVDLTLAVPISNGGMTKSGLGTLLVLSNNPYSGGTTIAAGRLFVNNAAGSGTGSGDVTVANGATLGGHGTIAGVVSVDNGGMISPGTSIGTLTVGNPPVFNGITFMEIDRNGGSPLADKIHLTSGTLTYGGTLVVTNIGGALTGGEKFALFDAPAYAGAFASFILPSPDSGLNWYTDSLTVNGTIQVNRQPVAGTLPTFTNTAPAVLEIPFTTLTGAGTDPDGDSLSIVGVSLTTTNGIALITNGASITYSNSARVTDQFSYTLSDGRGGSISGVVNIVNIGLQATAEFAAPPVVNGNSVFLQFAATPGWTYHLERTTNLPPDWLTIWTNVAPGSGAFDYTDTFQDLGAAPARAFYQLRWMP